MQIEPKYDVFISHASEDKLEVARPLAALLIQHGLKVWLDESELTLGDSLRRSIDAGLASSRFGVVILSKHFFAKEWPQKELDALVSKESDAKKVILPIWHNLSKREVSKFSPLLADKLGANTLDGIPSVANKILTALSKQAMRNFENSAPHDSPEQPGQAPNLGPKSIDKLMLSYLDRIIESAQDATEVTGVRTGLFDLDRILSGLQFAELYVVGARPGVGATSFCVTVAQHVALQEELPIVYFAPNVSSAEVVQRLIAAAGRIDRYALKSGRLRDDEWTRLTNTAEALGKSHIFVDDSTELSSQKVCANARSIHAKYGGLGLIVVDTFSALEDVQEDTSAKTAMRALSHLARELHCPIILAASLPRNIDARIDKRPLLGDLHFAECAEVYCSGVAFLYRDDYYSSHSKKEGMVEVILARNRNAPAGTLLFAFDKQCGRLDNLAIEPSKGPEINSDGA